jgi:hypothetical protein
MEYREVIVRQSGSSRWNDLDRLLNLSACYRGNRLHVSPSFYFRTISADQDDAARKVRAKLRTIAIPPGKLPTFKGGPILAGPREMK